MTHGTFYAPNGKTAQTKVCGLHLLHRPMLADDPSDIDWTPGTYPLPIPVTVTL